MKEEIQERMVFINGTFHEKILVKRFGEVYSKETPEQIATRFNSKIEGLDYAADGMGELIEYVKLTR